MRGTEKYAHETQLSKRVGAWQEKLEPLMERQAAAIVSTVPANLIVVCCLLLVLTQCVSMG